MTTKNSNKGIVFFTNTNNESYYINNKRQFVKIENPRLLSTDNTFKETIAATAKPYTYRGYKRIENDFYRNHNAKKTTWLAINYFLKKKYFFHLDVIDY